MTPFIVFTKKEFTEAVRTYKLMILGCVYLLLGMMNPLTAKFMPDLLSAFMPEGMNIVLAEPSALDSWTQFYKNLTQMGMIVLVITFSGIMANEFARGTLINVLTKGLKRRTVILSKFTVASLIWSAVYIMCYFVTYAYTLYFFREDRVPHLNYSVFCLWLFGIVLIAILLFGGVLFKSSYGCLLFTGVFVVILFLANMFPKIKEYNPLILASSNMDLLTNQMIPSDFLKAIIVSIVVIIISLIGAILFFNKKQL